MCVATIADDGTLTLRLRMPDCLAEQLGKYLVIESSSPMVMSRCWLRWKPMPSTGPTDRQGEKAARATCLGQAISYRFKRDDKGWRIFATTDMAEVPVATDRRHGVIGVDLNADHLAVAETDASGNWLRSWRVPLITYGKSAGQAEALNAVAGVVSYAKEAGCPSSLRSWTSRQKKSGLEGESRRYSRMLSSFSYGKVKAYFLSRGYRHGVEVHQVNPAYSSIIGRVKFMERYGLSVHQAAALVLARRLLGCSERIPRRRVYPAGNGVHVAFTVPVRKRVKHVWTYWGAVSRQLRPALQRNTGWGSGDRTQSGSGCRADRGPRRWLERGPVRSSRVRFPGGAALNCWGGGAAWTASSEKADGSPVTKVNLFYNG